MKYSLKDHGRSYRLSDHFALGEMACKDGSDTVLVNPDLIRMLERLREYVGGSITINSGYRTAAYNKKIGGAELSQHVKGTAADITVKANGRIIPGKMICCLCQCLGFKGIGYISPTSVHVDMRPSGIYRGDERKGYAGNVGGDFYAYFGIQNSEVKALKAAPAIEKKEAATKKEKTEKTEDEEMIYKTIGDVPDWGKPAVQLRIDHGWTDGKNLTESMVRAWTVQDREDPYIVSIEDVPHWAKDEVSALIDAGRLKGTGVEQIGMRFSALRAIIVMNRG